MPGWLTRWRNRRANIRAEAQLQILNSLHERNYQTLSDLARSTGLTQHLVDGHVRDMVETRLIHPEWDSYAGGPKYEVFVLTPAGRQTWETFNESRERKGDSQ